MNLLDLVKDSGGDRSIDALAGSLGLGKSQAETLIASLAPTLVRSLENQAAGAGDGLKRALENGHHSAYLDEPERMQAESTREDGNKILGHLFGSKDVSRRVAAQASERAGIDVDTIKKALPLVAGLAMGALSKKKPAAEKQGAGLGGLLGALRGGDDDGLGVDDLLGFARKFF